MLCGAPGDDPHHVRRSDYGAGLGIKPDDCVSVPLCRFHHRVVENNPRTYELEELKWIIRTLVDAIKEGYFVEKDKN